jgi:hypothetical protein
VISKAYHLTHFNAMAEKFRNDENGLSLLRGAEIAPQSFKDRIGIRLEIKMAALELTPDE